MAKTSKTRRMRILKQILPLPMLFMIWLMSVDVYVWAGDTAKFIWIALGVNTILLHRVTYLPGRLGQRIRASLLGTSFAVILGWFIILPFGRSIYHYLFIATVCFVIGSWALLVMFIAVVALWHFLQLQEMQAAAEEIAMIANPEPLVLHLTDVHMTAADDVGRIEKGQGGRLSLNAALNQARAVCPKYVIFSGDTTDTGDPREWERVRAILDEFSSVEWKYVFAPGNHDLSPYYGEYDWSKLRLFIENQARYLPNLMTATGERLADLITRAQKEITPAIAGHAAKIRSRAKVDFNFASIMIQMITGAEPSYWSKRAVLEEQRRSGRFWLEELRTMWWPSGWYGVPDDFDWSAYASESLLDEWFAGQWHDLFPFVLQDRNVGLSIIVLNSIHSSAENITESAVGRLGEGQLARLRTLLDCTPEWVRTVIVVTHHPPFRRPGEWRLPLPQAPFRPSSWGDTWRVLTELALLPQDAKEARDLVNSIAASADRKRAAKFLLLCGHRHMKSIGHAGEALVVEGDSLASSDGKAWLIGEGPNGLAISILPVKPELPIC